MKQKRKKKKKRAQLHSTGSNFTGPPVVVNAIANSYGYIGGWGSFLTPVRDER